MTRFLLPTAAVSASILLTGCGGAASEATAPKGAPTYRDGDDLNTPEGAAAAVDRAERSIDQLLGGPRQSATIAQQGAFAEAPPPPPPPAPAAEPPRTPPPVATAAPEARPTPAPGKKADMPNAGDAPRALNAPGGEACGTACAALASMERAAEHLCSLAGPGDERCTGARTRVRAAATRVHAACPVCHG